MVIDAIDPVGTLDRRAYERIGRAFEVEAALESYFTGDMIEDVGIYYGMMSRFASPDFEFDSLDGCSGASKALIKEHIPFGVTGSFHSLSDYKLLVIPMLGAEDEDYHRILDYVKEGGNIYFSGARHPEFLLALMGADLSGYSEYAPVYVAPKDDYLDIFGEFDSSYPMPFNSHAPLLSDIKNGKVRATFTFPYTKISDSDFSSIHSNPPGIRTEYPAMVEGNFGRGRFIWSALPIEVPDFDEYRGIFIGALRRLLSGEELSFMTDAPGEVEITLFSGDGEAVMHTVHLVDGSTLPIVSPFEVRLSLPFEVGRVELLPSGQSIPFTEDSGRVIFKTEPMHILSSYRISAK